MTKFLTFLKKNAFYLVLAFCAVAITLAVILAVNVTGSRSKSVKAPEKEVVEPEEPTPQEPDDKETPTVVEDVIFVMPVGNAIVTEDYSEMAWNETLGRFESHKAIDFSANAGESVVAVWGGVVESVSRSALSGITVTINHGDGLKTIYNSLDEDVSVSVGDTVTKGETIGAVGVSNIQELHDGAHLHFEVLENGKIINPEKYLSYELK